MSRDFGPDWEAHVRAPWQRDGAPTEEPEEPLVICTPLPAPPRLPSRRFPCFGIHYIQSPTGRVPVPAFAIVRNHGEPPLIRSDHLDCRQGPFGNGVDMPGPRDVIVLAARDHMGRMQYGWYMRLASVPDCLVPLPPRVSQTMLDYVNKTPELNKSSLKDEFLDAVFTEPNIDFNKLAVARYRRLRTAATSAASARGHKRKRSDTSPPPSAPASPAHPASLGRCSVCLDDGIELSDRHCCGAQGSTCVECHAKLRHYCPICDRSQINAAYQCLTCNSIVPLQDYGFPCVGCDECSLCVACYREFGECTDCDPLRRRHAHAQFGE